MGCSVETAGSSFFSAEAEASAEASFFSSSFFSALAGAETSALGSTGAAGAVEAEVVEVVSALGGAKISTGGVAALGGAKMSTGGVAALGGAKISTGGVVTTLVEPKSGAEGPVSIVKGKLTLKSSTAGIAPQSIGVKLLYLV